MMLRLRLGRLFLIFAILTASWGGVPASHADPLTGRHGSTDAAAGDSPVLGGGLVRHLAEMQRELNDALSAEFRDVHDTGSKLAIAVILALAFLYGVLHAIGPGHGKAVVASYFVANKARWTAGIVMGSMISLLQGVTAILLVGVLAIILQWRQFDVLNRTTLVEFVSYGLIAALGAVMFYRAVTGKGHLHSHGFVDTEGHDRDHAGHDHPQDHEHDHGPKRKRGAFSFNRWLILAAGVTPCASAIIILLFALANDAFTVGIAAVAALSLGMAITVSSVGIVSVLGRHTLTRIFDRVGVQSHRLEQGLTTIGALFIVVASGLLMVGAWARL